MTAEKQVLEAVERAQAILARYVEPGRRDCERTVNLLLDVLDRDEVVAAVEELERRGEAVDELKCLLDRSPPSWNSPPRNAADSDLPPMPPEKRPQDPIRFHRGSGQHAQAHSKDRRAAYGRVSRSCGSLAYVVANACPAIKAKASSARKAHVLDRFK